MRTCNQVDEEIGREMEQTQISEARRAAAYSMPPHERIRMAKKYPRSYGWLLEKPDFEKDMALRRARLLRIIDARRRKPGKWWREVTRNLTKVRRFERMARERAQERLRLQLEAGRFVDRIVSYALRKQDVVESYGLIPKEAIMAAFQDCSGLTAGELRGAGRRAHLIKIKHPCVWMLYKHTPLSCTQAAYQLGWTHHTTVMHAIKKVEANFDEFLPLLLRVEEWLIVRGFSTGPLKSLTQAGRTL